MPYGVKTRWAIEDSELQYLYNVESEIINIATWM